MAAQGLISLQRRGCRFAFQSGTRPLNDLNKIAETEVPTQAVQSRLARTFWALEMELVDRSIDRGIFEGDARFAQEIRALPYPFNRDSARKSLIWRAANRTNYPESGIEVPIDNWALHCHKSHHTMNAMGHDLRTFIGAKQSPRIIKAITKLVPDYMPMGSSGMGDMASMHMPGPDNALPMMTGTGQFGPIEMGGMFTLMKIRDGLTRNDY